MSNLRLGPASRETVFGLIVRTGPQTFPQGGPGTSTLFTIHTGAVLVTSLLGVLTTSTTTDPVLSLGVAPSGAGTAETNGLATTVALTSIEAGTWVSVVDAPTTNKAGALTFGAHAGNVQYNACAAFPVSAGAITQTATTAEAGAISWYLTYVPLDDGAYVGALLT